MNATTQGMLHQQKHHNQSNHNGVTKILQQLQSGGKHHQVDGLESISSKEKIRKLMSLTSKNR